MNEQDDLKAARERVLKESSPEFMMELKVGDFMAFVTKSGNITDARIQDAVAKLLPIINSMTLREVAALLIALMAAYMDSLHKNAIAVVQEREAQG